MKRFLPVLMLTLALAAAARAELKLTARWPEGDGACPDTPLRLTFDREPALGASGKLEVIRASDGATVETIEGGARDAIDRFGTNGGYMLHYEPLWVTGTTAHLRLHSSALTPGETYRVRVSAGMFPGFSGLADGWTFRVKPAMARNPDRVVVAADGTGDFCTIQGAVDRIEPHRERPAVVFVCKGQYREMVRIGRERGRIQIVGEDRHQVVLSYLNNEKLNPGWMQRAVLGVEADDFVLENLTVQNTTPYKGSQAEAVTLHAERCVLRHADFLSLQDTLDLSGRVFVADSYIEGDVDFVWGYGTAVFDKCELRSMHDGYLVQARNPAARAGYVFRECKLTAPPEVKKCWLARIEAARFPASHVAFIRCAMGPHILPVGWQVTGDPAPTLRFEEFGSTDLQGQPLDLSRRASFATPLTPEQAAAETPARVLAGTDGWKPE